LLAEFISRACPATAELIKPIKPPSDDFLKIGLDDTGKRFVASFEVGNGEVRAYDSQMALRHGMRKELMRRVPERKHMAAYERWALAATDTTAVVLAASWPLKQTRFATESARTTFSYLLGLLVRQAEGVRLQDAWNARKEVRDVEGYVRHPDNPLADYQRMALAAAADEEGFGLFMEQGTGKSAVAVALASILSSRAEDGKLFSVLVVCPKNVRSNWAAEFAKFATQPGQLTIMRGDAIERMKRLTDVFRASSGDVRRWAAVIASYEIVGRSWEAFKNVRWGLTVLDESHAIKSPTAKRSKSITRLRDRSDRRLILTGTPVTNSVMDLWTQLEFLREGGSGFVSYKNFKAFYGKFIEVGGDGRRIEKYVGAKNLPVLQERLARVTFRVTKKQALPDLPEKTYCVEEVAMTKQQARVYDRLRKALIVELEEDMRAAESAGRVVTATHVFTKLMRLAQITSGFVKADDGTVTAFSPNPKLEAVVAKIAALPSDEKAVVWATFVGDIQRMSSRLTAEGVRNVVYYGQIKDDARDAAVAAFNKDRDCRVFLGNPAAGGVGINLWGYDERLCPNTNCTLVGYYSQNWSMTERSQSEDRSHRRGTRAGVNVVDFVVPGTIDEEIRVRVIKKRTSAEEVQNLREIISRIAASSPEVE